MINEMGDTEQLESMLALLHQLIHKTGTLTHATRNFTIRRFATMIRRQLDILCNLIHWLLSLAKRGENQ